LSARIAEALHKQIATAGKLTARKGYISAFQILSMVDSSYRYNHGMHNICQLMVMARERVKANVFNYSPIPHEPRCHFSEN
jgi:hypothetical protein